MRTMPVLPGTHFCLAANVDRGIVTRRGQSSGAHTAVDQPSSTSTQSRFHPASPAPGRHAVNALMAVSTSRKRAKVCSQTALEQLLLLGWSPS